MFWANVGFYLFCVRYVSIDAEGADSSLTTHTEAHWSGAWSPSGVCRILDTGSRTCYVSVDDYEASCEAQQWRILSPNEILCEPASGSTMLSSKTIQGKSRAAH